MKKLAGIVSLICMIVTADCGAEPNLNGRTLSNVPSNVPVQDLKESASAGSPSSSEEIQTGATEPRVSGEFAPTAINASELSTLIQNFQEASAIEKGSELWKILSAENQGNN